MTASKFAFVSAERANHAVSTLCRVVGISVSGFYASGHRGPRTAATTSQSAPNLVERNFVADRPDQTWLADISFPPTDESWLNLAAVAAALNGSRAIRLAVERPPRPSTPYCNQVRLMLRRPLESGQYACNAYQAALTKAGITASYSLMSRASTTASAFIQPWTTARRTRRSGKQQT